MLQVCLGAAAFVLSVILCILTVVLFGMGAGGLTMGNLISTFLALLFAVISGKGFRQLITPKQLR